MSFASSAAHSIDHLLVIDDNEAIHADFRKLFAPPQRDRELHELTAELFGDEPARTAEPEYCLHCASQGEAGFALLRERLAEGIRFSAAFVDMRMPPGWDGVTTIEHLWQADPDLPVVICTAYSDHTWQEIARRLGTSDQLFILKKPFDEIEVRQLAASLRENRHNRELKSQQVQQLSSAVLHQTERLQEVERDADHLIAVLPSLLIALDEFGCVTRINGVAEQILSVSAAESMGRPFLKLPIPWVDVQPLREALAEDAGGVSRLLECRIQHPREGLRMIEFSLQPLHPGRSSQARLITGNDVTVQRLAQSQLEQSRKMESIGQLAAGVAHEINTPMQYISDNVRYVASAFDHFQPLLDSLLRAWDEGSGDASRPGLPDPSLAAPPKKLRGLLKQIPGALADCIEGVENVSRIIAAMKEFSHPGSDEASAVDLHHALNSTITVARNEWKYVADVTTDFAPGELHVIGLAAELNQAFLNIIVNAAHAIGGRIARGEMERGAIHIATRRDGDSIEVHIADNGGGIPAAIQHRVFEPFFTTKPVGKGTGQGLAIAFDVIQRKHGGRVSFEVVEGEGTTFILSIPCQGPAAEEITPQTAVESLPTPRV